VLVEEGSAYGTLKDVIAAHRSGGLPSGLDVTALSKAAFGIAFTMSQLHELGIVHRWLTADSVTISETGEPLITNFSEARFVSERIGCDPLYGRLIDHDDCWYIAPEAADDDTPPALTSRDVFSYGSLLFNLLSDGPTTVTGKVCCSNYQILLRIVSGRRLDRRPGISDDFWELITDCWHQDPARRPSFAEITDRMLASTELTLPGTDLDEYGAYQARITSRPVDTYSGLAASIRRSCAGAAMADGLFVYPDHPGPE
jgi:serine/threonine-protein kinase